MLSFFNFSKNASTVDSFEEAPVAYLADHLLEDLDRIKKLESSRFFENIFNEKGLSEHQSNCYIGNFRLIFGRNGSLTTIDWRYWDENAEHYEEIAFFQRLETRGDWYVVSTFVNEELLERLEQVNRLLSAMETYENFMNRRKAELEGKKDTKAATGNTVRRSA